MKLSERKIKILQAIIHDYINTADPIGSRTLSKKYELGVSAATIRNEMSELEEMGFLAQPHTSSGRIPTDKAYRFYVDTLMKLEQMVKKEKEKVKKHLLKEISEADKLLKYGAEYLAEYTDYTSIAMSKRIKENKVKLVKTSIIGDKTLLIVVITDTGSIDNEVLSYKKDISVNDVEKLINYIEKNIIGLTAHDIEKILVKNDLDELENNYLFKEVIILIINILKELDNIELFLKGQTNIFNFPEFNNVIKARSFLSMLEQSEVIANLLSGFSKEGLEILIGEENPQEIVREYSIITATYKVDHKTISHLSVIGPTRMDYNKVISIMNQIDRYMKKIIKTKKLDN